MISLAKPLCSAGYRLFVMKTTLHLCRICLTTFRYEVTTLFFHAKTRQLVRILIIPLCDQFQVNKLCILRAYWQVSAVLA